MMLITLDPVGRVAVELVPGSLVLEPSGRVCALAGQAEFVLAHRGAWVSQHRKAKGESVACHVWICDSSADCARARANRLGSCAPETPYRWSMTKNGTPEMPYAHPWRMSASTSSA